MSLREQLERATLAATPDRRALVVYHAKRVAIAVGLAVLTYLLFPASPAVDFPVYEVGSVAADNVIAPFAFRVVKSDADLAKERDAVSHSAEPIFDFVPAALDSTRRQLDAFITAVDDAARTTDSRHIVPAIQQAALSHSVQLSAAEASYLASAPRRAALFGAVERAFERWLPAGVSSSGTLDTLRGEVITRTGNEERRTPADSVATFAIFVARARLLHPDPRSPVGDALFRRLLAGFFHPTMSYDVAASAVRRDQLVRAVPATKFEVRAGEKIIGAHEVVGRDEHDKLQALRDAVDQQRLVHHGLSRVIGSILFNFLVIGLLGLAIYLFRPKAYEQLRWLAMFAVATVVVLVGAAIVARERPVHPELIPVTFAVVMISVLFDQRIAMITALVLSVLLGGQSIFRGTNALMINIVGGVVAAFSVRAIRRRNQIYHWILTIGLAYFAIAVAIGLALEQPTSAILSSAGLGALNALVSVLIAILLLPAAESFTGIETDLTLLEWSDLNRPLMQRLSLEAPGTYAHTIAIANLADAAARAIGANALLARVGAYYHDIGKIAKPQYFVENQAKGRNPHDRLEPNASARIIRNHVGEGLELADEFNLPRALRAFITEHHGTGAISYFFQKAKERPDEPPPDPADYAYPGPLPQTAETAVVMLADGVEAATRVLSEPTPQRIREVVDHIIRQRIEQGQLRDAPLTLRQLEIIREEFARVLTGMYHNRIDYPAASGGITSGFASV